jgi:hypothetical protein
MLKSDGCWKGIKSDSYSNDSPIDDLGSEFKKTLVNAQYTCKILAHDLPTPSPSHTLYDSS